MKPKSSLTVMFLIALLAVTLVSAQGNQPAPSAAELKKEIAKLDSLVFDAFNKRDVGKFKSFFAEDLEFYHDKGGLTGYDHTVSFIKGIAEKDNGLKRELVKENLEVYAVPGYGAMQIGSHTFCHPENGKMDCGTFKFVHIWKKTDGDWKITRVVSYDH